MFKSAKGFFKKMAYRVLDLDDTVQPTEQLKLFEDYLGKYEFDTNTSNITEFLDILKKKLLSVLLMRMDHRS